MTTARSRRSIVLASLAALTLVLSACTSSSEAPVSPLAGATPGAVELITGDLAALTAFYSDGVGLAVLETDDDTTSLGADGREILRLVLDHDDLTPDDPRQAGLYHSAFLYEDDAELASALLRTVELAPTSFQGSSDHSVSEAFYFSDPEGNGVELYRDRPADQWKWTGGRVTMGSAPLDPDAFIREALGTNEPRTTTSDITLGHVHLRGGSLDDARAFYADVLGLSITADEDNGAVFLASDGYHHHIAVNVWSSDGTGERASTRGLSSVTVNVDDPDQLDALEQRLAAADVPYDRLGDVVEVADPWGTRIKVVA